MSSTRWVAPAAIFLERTEAIIWPSLSMSSARSMRIRMSSAGLKRTAPPQAMQPPSRWTTSRIWVSVEIDRRQASPSCRRFPAGEVMAREEVLGMVRPSAATMATMMGVVRLPGNPPTECLSTMMGWSQRKRSPTIDHGAGEAADLIGRQRLCRASGDEGRNLDCRITARDDVRDDFLQRRLVQGMTEDAAAHQAQGAHRRRVPGGDGVALLEIQAAPGGVRKSRFVAAEKIRLDLIKRGDHLARRRR